MIETLASLTAVETSGPAVATPSLRTPGTDFGAWVARELEVVNQKIETADIALRKLAVGQAANLHETMMALESAKLSFELVVQVRNRILEAYQEMIRMQV